MKKTILLLLIALLVSGCQPKVSDNVIRVGATPTPHALVLEQVKDDLEALGYTLEIVEFTDYFLVNPAVVDKDLDANYFQHIPFLEDFNTSSSKKIESALVIHFEPLGIYPGREQDLNAILNKGATIAIPNDTSNGSRALKLLEDLDYLKLKAQDIVSVLDIVDNPYNIQIKEIAAEQIPNNLADVDFGIINGNHALAHNLSDGVLMSEGAQSDAASIYGNVLAVREGEVTSAKTKALVSVLRSEKVKQYIIENFSPVVIPVLP